MKIAFVKPCGQLLAFFGLALCLGAMFTGPAAVAAEETGKKVETGLMEKVDRWQERMSEKFRNTWRDLWGSEEAETHSKSSVTTAAADVREQQDTFMVRLHLPGRALDKVDIKLENGRLLIVAPQEKDAGRYEQTVAMAGIEPGAELKISRIPEDHLIIVTIPKAKDAPVAAAVPPPTVSGPALLPLTEWERDVFARMERMRREMDNVFEGAFNEFRTQPGFEGWFDAPQFGASIDLQEKGDRYVVHAYLPHREIGDINVTVEDRLLKIEAKEEEIAKKEGESGILHSTRRAAYSQILTLPGPVRADDMQVERKEGMLVVILPKAES